jgi:hypothetical protein
VSCRHRLCQQPGRSEQARDFGFRSFSATTYRELAGWRLPIALSTDVGPVLVGALIYELREHKVLAPALSMIERLAWETRRRAERLRVRPSHRRPDQRTPRAAGRPAGSSARRADDHPGSVAPTPRRPTPATFVPQVRVPPVPPPALRRNEHELERVGFALGHLPYVLEVGNGSAAESLPADKATHGIACRLERMPHGLAAQRVRAERLTWRLLFGLGGHGRADESPQQ